MPKVELYTAQVWQSDGLRIMARILGNEGVPIMQIDFGTIRYGVWEMPQDASGNVIECEDGKVITPPTSLTVGDVVFDTLVTDDPSGNDAPPTV